MGLFWIQKCCSQFLLNAKFAFLLLQVNSYKWPKNIVNSYWYNCFTEKPQQVKGRKQYDLSPKLKGIKKAFNQMKIMYTRQSSMPCLYHYKIVSVRLWWLRSWIHVMIVLLARRKVQVNLEISHVLSVTTFRFINVFPWWKCCFSYYHECLVLKVFVLFKWYQHLTWHLNFKIWTWSFCIIFQILVGLFPDNVTLMLQRCKLSDSSFLWFRSPDLIFTLLYIPFILPSFPFLLELHLHTHLLVLLSL